MKKAILVFTKVPRVGDCKTRLTEARGGILTYEEATKFYEACVLDVIDVCLSVENADFWICYNKEGDRAYLDNLLTQVTHPERIAGVFSDQGGTFDECMQYASDYILKSGGEERLADAILISGGDLPTLQPHILVDALNKLEVLSKSEAGQKVALSKVQADDGAWIGAALVEGSCQEGGFSLVGQTCTTKFDYYSVFYNVNGITALDRLATKAIEEDLPLAYVEQVPDIDIPVDLASQVPMLSVIEHAAKFDDSLMVPRRTITILNEMGIVSVALPPEKTQA
ncbi:DUF2064 domain-containing protein [Desulfitobacterium sp. PCE1]|uniref:TIGR04282 family arsenosugar biosynthesis glycosyltransferase n=1 Tax=Desulfitobacterium sp. PCE1 TaxID=146907 RepID=UPI00037C7753|nr:DUF2064 domain-containing protein [Desulfitobacterium sp. PCE1]